LTLSTNGSLFLTRPTLGDYIRQPSELQARGADLFRWVSEGTLDVHIGATFPMEEAADAHRALEGRMTTGKLLITPQ
jgi:NADPH2:quinone reductase